jgi:transposase
MRRFVEGVDRGQSTLFPECLEDWIYEDNPVRAIDVFVGGLDLAELGFDGVDPEATGRPSYHPTAIRKVCARFVTLCRELDPLTSASVAIDGSKFKAVNARDKNFTRAKMQRRLAQIEESVARYLSQLDTADRDRRDGDGDRGALMALPPAREASGPSRYSGLNCGKGR